MKDIPEICGQYAILKPMVKEDAEFLFELRGDAELTRYINDAPPTLDDQLRWMKSYFERDNDHNFIVYSKAHQARVGTVALVDIDLIKKTAEPGRWLIKGDPLAAIEADLLINRHGFETLGLKLMHFSVFAVNAKVISYHNRCGARRTATVPSYFHKQGVPYDAHLFEIDLDTYLKMKKPMLEKLLYRKSLPD